MQRTDKADTHLLHDINLRKKGDKALPALPPFLMAAETADYSATVRCQVAVSS
jgi:hypothetical protein